MPTRIPPARSAFEAMLPSRASVVTTRADVADAVRFPEEEVAVERAVERRRREFVTARACARAALEPWGLSERPIPMGSGGEPQWPAGIVGSITHCDGFRACAVADEADVVAIGIDAEPNRPLPEGVLAHVAFGDELTLVRRLAESVPDVRWDRLLFSAKESVYKAWFPLARRRLGFGDAVLTIDPRTGAFAARLLVRGPPLRGGEVRRLAGRWAVEGELVLTAVVVPRDAG